MQLAHSSCQETNLHSKWVPKVCIFLWKSRPRAVIGLQGFWTEIPSENSCSVFHPMGAAAANIGRSFGCSFGWNFG